MAPPTTTLGESKKGDPKNQDQSGTEMILEKLDRMEARFSKEILDYRNEVKKQGETLLTIKTDIKTLQKENINLKRELQELNEKYKRMEMNSGQKNLIINGLSEKPNENITAVVKDLFTEKLDLNPSLDLIHRLGKPGEKPRPVKVSFIYLRQRNEVWEKRRNLQGTNIFLNEDLPIRVRKERALLRGHKKQAEEEGKEAIMKGKFLLIDGKKFIIRNDRLVNDEQQN